MYPNITPLEQDKFEAIILAGGKGSRLSPFTDYCPKPLLKVGNKSILEYILKEIKSSGINNITIGTRYLKKQIHDIFSDKYNCTETDFETMVDSFGFLGNLSHKNYLLCLSGDTLITKDSLEHTMKKHLETQSDITFTLSETKKSKKKWRYLTDEKGFLQELTIGRPENNLERSGLVINKEIADILKEHDLQNFNYENFDSGWNLIFKIMLDQNKKICVSKKNFPVFNINTGEELRKAEYFVEENLI